MSTRYTLSRRISLSEPPAASMADWAAFEAELVQLYEAATRYCAQVGDHDNRLFFEGLLEEERRHGEALTAWLESLRQPGPAMREPRVTF